MIAEKQRPSHFEEEGTIAKKILQLSLLFVLFVSAGFSQNSSRHAALSRAAPESVGLSSARLARLAERMQRYVDDRQVAGALTLVARHGKIAHFATTGYADLKAKKPLAKDALFRIYSMTKPIVSVGLMTLYEEGRFQLADPVAKFIPEIRDIPVLVRDGHPPQVEKQKRGIRIIDLLRHTSGFGYGWGPGTAVDSLYAAADLWESRNLTDFFGKVKKIPLYFQPGTKWRYGISADIMGYLIERISAQPLNKFLQERIFRPLGMRDTAFQVPQNRLARLATLYGWEKKKDRIKAIGGPMESSYAGKVHLLSGGGGLVSTAMDYLHFCQMLLNGGELAGTRILGPKTIELMTRNHIAGLEHGGGPVVMPRPGYGFGLGFAVVTDLARTEMLGSEGAYGWGGLAGTYFRIDPQENLILILMIQLIPYSQTQIQQTFQTLVYQAIVQ